MNANNIYVLSVAALLGIGDFVKTIGDKVMSINNTLKVRNSSFIVGNLCKLAKASEWNELTSPNLADFATLPRNTECQIKEVVKTNQTMQCNVKNIKDIAFACHREGIENRKNSTEGEINACFMRCHQKRLGRG